MPVRQWVLTLPYPLRYRCAWNARLTSEALRSFLRAVFADYRRRAKRDLRLRGGACGSVTFIQRFGSALNLTPHFIAESTFAYLAATRAYMERFGKPVAFYSDQASVFRVTPSRGQRNNGLTQFGRALSELNVDIICANTPQAKGRVERAHLTLQGRLVKELRLRGISTLAEANAHAPEFMEDFNARFGKEPLSEHDAHRPIRDDEDLELILSHREERKVSQQLTVHFRRAVYLLEPGLGTLELHGERCHVREFLEGRIEIRYAGEPVPFSVFNERRVTQGEIVANKRLGAVLAKIQADQRERDEERLASPKLNRRRKQQIRAARERADTAVEARD